VGEIVQNQTAVDFIRAEYQIMAATEFAEALELRAAPDAPDGIVRVAEKK
jgi:hypothetical protein